MFLRLIIAALATGSAVIAQEPDIVAGQEIYAAHCVQCHGTDAKGDGPMAELLAIDTPNLTDLAKRNDNIFPTHVVAMQIDGRAPMLAHGGEMPVFGPFLDSDQHVVLRMADGQPMMTGLPLANIVTYLESIQEK
jgi:mono/diheme cytochrome c family protein